MWISSAKSLPAAVAYLLVLAPIASAAAFTCSTNVTVSPTLSAEGFAEFVGDITLSCTGGTPIASGTAIPQDNFTIFLNTGVTSRLIPTQASPTASEALLVLDEPGVLSTSPLLVCATPATGCVVNGTTGTAEPFNGTAGRPNVFQGVVQGNSVTFFGVPVDAPAGTASRVFRFTNIRVNATSLAGGSAAGATPVIASISVSGATAVPISNPTSTVGFVGSGFSSMVRDGSDLAPLSSGGFLIQQASGQPAGGSPSAFLRFAENFGTTFKTRTSAAFVDSDTSPAPASQMTVGSISNNQSNLTVPVTGGTAGLADFGTRLKATFSNIPFGVRVFVGLTNFTGTAGGATPPVGRLVASESGTFSAVTASTNFGTFPVAELPIAGGNASAVWEVLRANPNANESMDFPVWFTASAPSIGTGTVSLSFAPAPPAFTAVAGAAASSTLPLPRFSPAVSAPVVVVSVVQSVILTAIPSAVSFSFQIGSPVPLPQTVAIAVAGANSIAFAASASSLVGNWLSVTTTGNTLPGSLSLSVNPAGLAPSVYFGSLTVTASGASNSPLVIPVVLTVSAAGTVSANQVVSQIADGGGWKTSVILVNTGSTPASFALKFWDELGNPLTLPLGLDGAQAQVTDTIPVGGSRSIQTDGNAANLAVGWAELVTSNSIGGSAVFAFRVAGQPDSEAVVPITSARGQRFQLPFDNSPGFALGIAIANPGNQAAVVTVVFRDETGHQTGSAGPFNIVAHGHTSFVVSAAAGTRGVAEISSPGVDVTGLGIRSHGRTFTSIETLLAVPAGGKNISQIADGGGWKTTVVLVNTDTQPAAFTLQFWQDNGTALTLPLGPDGAHAQLSGIIPAGAARTIQTDDTSSFVAAGWAALVTSSAIGGTAIFGLQSPGQPDSEAAVPIVAELSNHFLLPFDGSFGFATGVAFDNPGQQTATISAVLRDVTGQQIGQPVMFTAPPNGHTSAVLAVSTQGVAEVTSDAPVASLGIRSHNGAFTSVRTLATSK